MDLVLVGVVTGSCGSGAAAKAPVALPKILSSGLGYELWGDVTGRQLSCEGRAKAPVGRPKDIDLRGVR